jgi:hypothetical protein
MKVKNHTISQYILLSLIISAMTICSCGSRSQGQQEQTVADDLQVIPDGWEPLMDGKTLAGWDIVRYGGEGEPYVKDGTLVLPMAVHGLMTGLCRAGDSLPVNNYIIYYEARRTSGNDIFGGLSFPYGDTFATLVVGGWGGSVCGLSSIDDNDASGNETTTYIHFKDNQWYPVQLRVTTDSIRAVIGTVKVVDIATAGKKINLRGGTFAPGLTLCTYLTTGEIRNLRLKRLP